MRLRPQESAQALQRLLGQHQPRLRQGRRSPRRRRRRRRHRRRRRRRPCRRGKWPCRSRARAARRPLSCARFPQPRDRASRGRTWPSIARTARGSQACLATPPRQCEQLRRGAQPRHRSLRPVHRMRDPKSP
eukprot:Amastigsp_a525_59.p4 type:complete len:132 gc:universal Amastigsp_a525_59:245-640(+)